MKKDGKTNSLKMTNKKEKYMLITVPLPVRKKWQKGPLDSYTSNVFFASKIPCGARHGDSWGVGSPPRTVSVWKRTYGSSALLLNSGDLCLHKGSLFLMDQLYSSEVDRHLVLGKKDGMVMQIILKTELTHGGE